MRRRLFRAAFRCTVLLLLCMPGPVAAQDREPDSPVPSDSPTAPGGGAADAAGAAEAAEADVREGRALYASHQCWQCHGYEGQGSVAGVRVAPTPYPFEAFSRLVRHTDLMPAYSPNVLSDAQLRLIYIYVRSIPEPPSLEDISELDFD